MWGYHPVADEVALLRWSDTELGGDGFVPWRRFDHPQLGEVEIGGFDLVRYWYNIPFDRLEKEVAPHSDWLVYLGLTTPRLAIRTFSADPLGADLWRVRLVVENQGFLPTHGTQKALDQQVSRGVFAELTLPPGARLVDGDARSARWASSRVASRSARPRPGGATPPAPPTAPSPTGSSRPRPAATIAVDASHDRAGRESRRARARQLRPLNPACREASPTRETVRCAHATPHC